MDDKSWTMKVKTSCPYCEGHRYVSPDHEALTVCKRCGGTGQTFKKVPPEEIESFRSRPPQTEFICVCCLKKEVILRPRPFQIPHSWMNWSNDIICNSCRNVVIWAAIAAADQKIRHMKERMRDART